MLNDAWAPRLTARYLTGTARPAEGYLALTRLLHRALQAAAPPAVAVEVSTASGPVYAAAGGWACVSGQPAGPIAATAQTRFDLASLTKLIVTVPLVLLLDQRGGWRLDDPVARWLPGAPRSAVTIRHCLTHTAGLAAHRPYFASFSEPAQIKRAVIGELAGAVPGTVCYSDLGYLLLGWAVEECAGQPLDVLASRELTGPLGMTSTGYRPATGGLRGPSRRAGTAVGSAGLPAGASPAELTSIAATEADGDQRLTAGLVWGQVHDGNAFALGGVCGHAGLFGTAADVARFAAALLCPARHPVLGEPAITRMMSRQTTAAADDVRAIGWRLRPAGWGDWPPGTLWHTGFTGTSMLIAPALDVAVVLLGNGVHPARQPAAIARLRAGLHQAVRAALD